MWTWEEMLTLTSQYKLTAAVGARTSRLRRPKEIQPVGHNGAIQSRRLGFREAGLEIELRGEAALATGRSQTVA